MIPSHTAKRSATSDEDDFALVRFDRRGHDDNGLKIWILDIMRIAVLGFLSVLDSGRMSG